MRIVSLIASSTEMVARLDALDEIVGRSHECDFPIAVKKLPQLTKPSIQVENVSSREIDAQVKSRVRDALSIYEVDREKLKLANPDVILTQTQCEVCAVSLKDVERALTADLGISPQIVSLNPNSLADIKADFRAVARAIHRVSEGERELARMNERMREEQARATVRGSRPRVALIEWIEPLMAAGNWMPELVALAGGENLFGEAGKHSPWMTSQDLVQKNPDLIVISPCGFDLERIKQELHLILDTDWIRGTSAYAKNAIFVADGNQYFNRPGPRVVESLVILNEIFEAAIDPLKNSGPGWERVFIGQK